MTTATAPKTKKPRVDNFFEKAMTSRGAVYWPQNMAYLIDSHGMNYYKVLCLQWRHSDRTPASCGNRRHDADKYLHTLECESQLTEALTMAMQGANQTCKKLAEVLLKTHEAMGCECDWKPKFKPPLRKFIKVKCPSRAYKIGVKVL